MDSPTGSRAWRLLSRASSKDCWRPEQEHIWRISSLMYPWTAVSRWKCYPVCTDLLIRTLFLRFARCWYFLNLHAMSAAAWSRWKCHPVCTDLLIRTLFSRFARCWYLLRLHAMSAAAWIHDPMDLVRPQKNWCNKNEILFFAVWVDSEEELCGGALLHRSVPIKAFANGGMFQRYVFYTVQYLEYLQQHKRHIHAHRVATVHIDSFAEY